MWRNLCITLFFGGGRQISSQNMLQLHLLSFIISSHLFCFFPVVVRGFLWSAGNETGPVCVPMFLKICTGIWCLFFFFFLKRLIHCLDQQKSETLKLRSSSSRFAWHGALMSTLLKAERVSVFTGRAEDRRTVPGPKRQRAKPGTQAIFPRHCPQAASTLSTVTLRTEAFL